MKTTYLLFKPGVCASVIERYVLHLKDSVKWVDSLEDATADYLPAIEATQERLKIELGLGPGSSRYRTDLEGHRSGSSAKRTRSPNGRSRPKAR